MPRSAAYEGGLLALELAKNVKPWAVCFPECTRTRRRG